MKEYKKYKLYLFDRDGTLTRPASGADFPKNVEDQEWIPGRRERVQQLGLHPGGAFTFMVTNQGGAAWGIFSIEDMEKILHRQTWEAEMTGFYVCYHDQSDKAKARAPQKQLTGPDLYKGHERRKPGPGMLLEAMDAVEVGPKETLYVGDRPEDQLAAEAAGCNFCWAWEFF